MNTTNASYFGVRAAAVLLFIVASGSAYADCEWSDRIDMDDAECLTGEWQNRTWPAKDTAEVKNECSTLGTVVAKVDREGAADWTKWLENKEIHSMSGAYGNIRGIHCCSDLSDLCNKEDIIHPENCIAAFEESPASATLSLDHGETSGCRNPRATADPDAETCTLEVECSYSVAVEPTLRRPSQSHTFVTETRQVTVPYLDVSKLVLSDNGQLSVQ